jgi:hypothetical protein
MKGTGSPTIQPATSTDLRVKRSASAPDVRLSSALINETEWPAYASIGPASWLVQRDVNEGRAVLKFSEWMRPQEEAKEAAEEVREGEMPPAAYALFHAHARLTPADRDRLALGLATTLGVALEQEVRERHR